MTLPDRIERAERGEDAGRPIPVEFYQWLYTIERDVRVWDLTPNEISALIAALARMEKTDEG